MTDYAPLILAMKFGFSAVLLISGLYGMVEIFRVKRSLRGLFSLPAALALVLMVVSVLLLAADHEKYYDFLNLVKILSGVFTLVYGIYATLNDFYEQDESGRRAITKIGMVGILLFFTSTILSIAADYVKNSIQKQEIEERRKYYASIVDKLVVVDQSTGKLNINFQKFTDNLFQDLKKTQTDLFETRKTLADREGRISTLERQLSESAKDLKAAEASLGALQSDLGATKERLGSAEERARDTKARLEETGVKLEKAGQSLAARQAEVREVRRQLGEVSEVLRKKDAELNALGQEAARIKEELRGAHADTAEWRRRADDLAPVREAFARRESELAGALGDLHEARVTIKRQAADLGRSRKVLDERLVELANGQRALEGAQKELSALQRQLVQAVERLRPKPAGGEPGP